MSLEILNAFIAKVQSDSSLLEQVKAVTDANGAVAIARSAGFDVTAGDFVRFHAAASAQLSDQELEGASGGGITPMACLPASWIVGVFSTVAGAVAGGYLADKVYDYIND